MTGAPPPVQRQSPDLEDEVDEVDLPPLDDGDDEEPGVGDVEELVSFEDEESALDEVNAGDLDVGETETIADEQPGGDEASEDSVDVGALDEDILDDEGEHAVGDAVEGIAGDEADEIDDLVEDGDDGGVEGTDDAIEDQVDDADLPELDADDDGDFEEEHAVDESLEESLDEALPPWDEARWVTREGAGASVPTRAVAVGRGRVAAAGDVVLAVDEGAHAARRADFEGGADAIAITDASTLVVTSRGQILEARGETEAAPLSAFRGGRGPVALAVTPGRVWVLQDGALWSLAGSPTTVIPVRDRGVVAIAASGPAIVALIREAGEPRIERLRSDDEGWAAQSVGARGRETALGDRVRLAAAGAGRAIGLADPSIGVAVSRDGGASFEVVEILCVVALCFAGDEEDAPLLALIAREPEGAHLVAQITAAGVVTLVAEIPAASGVSSSSVEDSGDLGPAAIVWDPARDVAWIACRSGLVAIGRARRH